MSHEGLFESVPAVGGRPLRLVRVGVRAGDGARSYVLADVLRRYLEFRGAQAWFVAPKIADLSGLNVPVPDDEAGPVDVRPPPSVRAEGLPTDRLESRLLILAHDADHEVPVGRRHLESAAHQLARWRAAVAAWSAAPSAPPASSYLDRAFEALSDGLQTPRVVELVEELQTDPTLAPGARFETAAALDRLLALELACDVGRRRLG